MRLNKEWINKLDIKLIKLHVYDGSNGYKKQVLAISIVKYLLGVWERSQVF